MWYSLKIALNKSSEVQSPYGDDEGHQRGRSGSRPNWRRQRPRGGFDELAESKSNHGRTRARSARPARTGRRRLVRDGAPPSRRGFDSLPEGKSSHEQSARPTRPARRRLAREDTPRSPHGDHVKQTIILKSTERLLTTDTLDHARSSMSDLITSSAFRCRITGAPHHSAMNPITHLTSEHGYKSLENLTSRHSRPGHQPRYSESLFGWVDVWRESKMTCEHSSPFTATNFNEPLTKENYEIRLYPEEESSLWNGFGFFADSGKIELVHKPSGQSITFSEKSIRQFVGNDDDEEFEGVIARLMQTQMNCEHFMSEASAHSGYHQARVLFELGIDLPQVHAHHPVFYRPNGPSYQSSPLPHVPEFNRADHESADSEPISIAIGDIEHYPATLMAHDFDLIRLRDYRRVLAREERAIEAADDMFDEGTLDALNAITRARQHREVIFTVITAALSEIKQRSTRLAQLIRNYSKLLNLINELSITVDTGSRASEGRVNESRIRALLRDMQQCGDYDSEKSLVENLVAITNEVSLLDAVNAKLFGNSALLATAGLIDTHQARAAQTRCTELNTQAHTASATLLCNLHNLSHQLKPSGIERASADLSVRQLIDWKKQKLQHIARVNIERSASRSPRAASASPAAAAAEEKSSVRPRYAAEEVIEHQAEITLTPDHSQFIVTAREKIVLSEATPNPDSKSNYQVAGIEVDTSNDLGQMQLDLWQSKPMQALRTYINHLLDDYDKYFDGDNKPRAGKDSKKAQYALLGRAKAEALSKIVKSTYANARTREYLCTSIQDVLDQPDRYSYRVQIPSNRGNRRFLELNLAQHRYQQHNIADGLNVDAESTTRLSCQWMHSIFNKTPKSMSLIAGIAQEAQQLVQAAIRLAPTQ